MKYPNPCDKCAPFGGSWQEGENGMKRCDCARGKALVSAAKAPPPREPMISPEHAILCAEMMATIPFYPPEAGARSGIADEISCMCETPEQAVWLVRRMKRLYRKWPGEIEMRLVFCGKFHPLDGIQATSDSEVYPNGIPGETENMPSLALAAPQTLQLASGGPVSASPSFAATVSGLVSAKSLDRKLQRLPPPKVAEIPVVRVTEANRITAADIERAVQEMRDKRAAGEIEGAA